MRKMRKDADDMFRFISIFDAVGAFLLRLRLRRSRPPKRAYHGGDVCKSGQDCVRFRALVTKGMRRHIHIRTPRLKMTFMKGLMTDNEKMPPRGVRSGAAC